jgi:hypothetical protein
MAVLDKNKINRSVSDTQEKDSRGTGEEKGKVVDLFQQKDLPTGEKHKLDATEDAWEYGAPPKAGRYSIKCFLAKDGVKLFDDDPNRPVGYGISLECKIVNSQGGEFDGVTLFPRVSTFIGRGKNISTAAGLIAKFGYKVPSEADALTIAKLLVQALKKEPVCDIEQDWQGWSKLDQRVAYRGQSSFPVDEHGEPIHIVEYRTVKGLIEEIRAQPNVVHWYGKGEASNAPTAGKVQTIKPQAQLRLAEDEESVQPAQTAGKASAASAGNGNTNTEEDDLQLLEE